MIHLIVDNLFLSDFQNNKTKLCSNDFRFYDFVTNSTDSIQQKGMFHQKVFVVCVVQLLELFLHAFVLEVDPAEVDCVLRVEVQHHRQREQDQHRARV